MASFGKDKAHEAVSFDVAQDALWRERLRREQEAAHQWEESWGFMRPSETTKDTRSRTQVLNDRRRPNVEGSLDALAAARAVAVAAAPDKTAAEGSSDDEEYLPKRRTGAFPSTTSSEVGWAWRNQSNSSSSSGGGGGSGSGSSSRSAATTFNTLEVYSKRPTRVKARWD